MNKTASAAIPTVMSFAVNALSERCRRCQPCAIASPPSNALCWGDNAVDQLGQYDLRAGVGGERRHTSNMVRIRSITGFSSSGKLVSNDDALRDASGESTSGCVLSIRT